MKQAIQKASVLIEALPHIQRFRGDTVVVKFGGSSMDNPETVRGILEDIAFMSCVGMRPVIVHGGGKSINARLKQKGLQATFVQGLRVTDAATMKIVEQVLNREVNPRLVAALNDLGCKARGIHGEDIIAVRKHTENPDTGRVLDWGFVGAITHVDGAARQGLPRGRHHPRHHAARRRPRQADPQHQRRRRGGRPRRTPPGPQARSFSPMSPACSPTPPTARRW